MRLALLNSTHQHGHEEEKRWKLQELQPRLSRDPSCSGRFGGLSYCVPGFLDGGRISLFLP